MKNALQLSYLVPLFPLIGFLIIGLGRRYLSKSLTGIIGNGVILASFLVSIWIFFQVKDGNSGVIDYFNFISAGNLKVPFAFQIDALSSYFF
jgi:NADH-quinone oxidoreductase subunit L